MTQTTFDLSAQISTLEPRTATAVLMRAALDTGIRKELREAVQHALELATGDAPKELSDLACRRLKNGNRLSDPQYAGLVLIATTRGKRWIYRNQVDGKQRQVTLGHYPTLSLAQARDKWVAARSVALNPAKADVRSQTTLEALTDAYITAQRARGMRSWKRTQNALNKHMLNNHANMILADVDADTLNACFVHLIDTQPGAARSIRMSISGLFTWAENSNRLPSKMAAPKLRPAPGTKIKTYVPNNGEMRTMLRGLDDMHPADANILRFQAMTGTRIGEALGADWSEIDLAAGRWTIPAERMKAKAPHTVMLSRQAIALLEAQTSRTGSVFNNRGRNAVMRNWSAQRDAIGLPEAFTSHVIRKALLTWLAENGAGRDIRDRMSAHSPGKSADVHYMLSELNAPAAEWWQRWADHLSAIESDNVVEIRA